MYRRMDIYDVAHDWANRTDNNASASAGNLYHAGGEIYSYGDHFMIAKHVWNERGEHAVLFTKQTYSRTTSKHVTIVNNASSHLEKLYVPNPSLTKEELFVSWHCTMVTIGHHLENPRKTKSCVLDIQRVFNEAKRYADFFDCELPAQLIEASAIQNLSQFIAHLQRERELREQAEATALNKRLKAQKLNLKNWRSFKLNYLNTADGFDYLRFNKITEQIETTQRVDIPITVGQQFYSVVLATVAQGGCKNCPEKLMDRHEVLEINAQFIRVGCHKISLKEIKSFAKQQGWS
jgi:hypothetical protein